MILVVTVGPHSAWEVHPIFWTGLTPVLVISAGPSGSLRPASGPDSRATNADGGDCSTKTSARLRPAATRDVTGPFRDVRWRTQAVPVPTAKLVSAADLKLAESPSRRSRVRCERGKCFRCREASTRPARRFRVDSWGAGAHRFSCPILTGQT